MSIVDLHPEELLDKHAQGALTEGEWARLEGHVSTCAVCRFELRARADFALMAVGPVDLAPPDAAAPPELDLLPAPLAPRRSRRRAWVLGLAAALVGGMSFAALSLELGNPWRARPVGTPGAAPHGTPARAASSHEAALPSVGEAPASVEATTQVAATRPADGERDRARGSPSRAPRATENAAELFRAANAARRVGDTERAVGLYRELQARYPRSEESRVSYATLGSLLLDRGEARSALDGFNQYLSRGDAALGEEALVGRALASQRLGARDGEAAAWQEILRRFPGSVHARLARTRLLELGQR